MLILSETGDMTVTIEEWRESGTSLAVIVDSIEGAIYRVSVLIDGLEHRLLDVDGKTFQRKSVTHVREALQGVAVENMTLRHSSAYDEMIGQGCRERPNTMQVPLAKEPGQV